MMETTNERMRVLEMIENGHISAQEGLRLLQAMNGSLDVETTGQVSLAPEPQTALPLDETPGFVQFEPGSEPASPIAAQIYSPDFHEAPSGPAPSVQAAEFAPSIRKWKSWWMLPLWAGVVVTIFGGLFMYQAMQSSGYGFWFFCASVPFVLGLALMVFAYQSRNAPWLHLRIQQPKGNSPERFAFSFPLPLGLAAWVMRVFDRFIPDMHGQDLGQMIQAVGGNVSPENPIFIEVDDEDGERVEVYIG